jgi:hypothetical protein
MLAPEAGSTDTTAIAFPKDMSRSKYPMMHESWLAPPPEPAAAVNWLTWAAVHWPGPAPAETEDDDDPPPHAVSAAHTAATAAAGAAYFVFMGFPPTD